MTEKLSTPFLIFCMPLDTPTANIQNLNPGRLTLWDLSQKKQIQRWVFSSSLESRQSIGSWNQVGGLCPPNTAMPGMKMYEVSTKRQIQPGEPVDDGFVILFDDNVEFSTNEGTTRSQIMIHEDKGAPGTLGCLGGSRSEYTDFANVFVDSCGHLATVPLGVIYTY